MSTTESLAPASGFCDYRIPMKRLAGSMVIGATASASVLVLAAGAMTPGYDPANRTISRLAERGGPTASAAELALVLAGLALIGLAFALGPRAQFGRLLLAGAGVLLLVAAGIPLDQGSAAASNAHRLATALSILALTCAPFALARAYGPILFWLGAAEVAVLLLGLLLLPTTFAVGAWERCLLALSMAWMVLLSARLLRTSSTEPNRSST